MCLPRVTPMLPPASFFRIARVVVVSIIEICSVTPVLPHAFLTLRQLSFMIVTEICGVTPGFPRVTLTFPNECETNMWRYANLFVYMHRVAPAIP